MDKLLEELSRGIGISNNALEKVVETVGGNYQEVYATLIKEFALYRALDNLFMGAMLFGLVLLALMIGLGFAYDNTWDKEEEKREAIISYAKRVLIGFVLVCIICVITKVVTPAVAPNVTLIMEILEARG